MLAAFAETGWAPPRTDVDGAIADRGLEVGSVLSELAECDVLALDEQGEIRAAYPFSPVQTRHRVTRAGGPTMYAMCAIDALGMSAMLGGPVTITSTEPGTGRTVTVQVDHDAARWQPDTAAVFAGHTGSDPTCCPSVDRSCGHINFFTTLDAAHDWAARNPGVTGVVLDQCQALARGIAHLGALLRSADQEPGR